MPTKFVLWAHDREGHRHLLALQLLPEENLVRMFTFPTKAQSEALHKQLQEDWRRDPAFVMPEESQQLRFPLMPTGGLLPEHLEPEGNHDLERLKSDWLHTVFSHKLFRTFERDWQEIQERVRQLGEFNEDLWGNLKLFWSKVQDEARKDNLLPEHTRELRRRTDDLFSQMKALRQRRERVREEASAEALQALLGEIDRLQAQVASGKKLRAAFEGLKAARRRSQELRLSRSQLREAGKRLDAAFDALKAKRSELNSSRAAADLRHLDKRYQGLVGAIDKMRRAVERDQRNIDYEKRQIERSDAQLQVQMLRAKVQMIEERQSATRSKLEEFLKIKTELDRKRKALQRKVAAQQAREKAKPPKAKVVDAPDQGKAKVHAPDQRKPSPMPRNSARPRSMLRISARPRSMPRPAAPAAWYAGPAWGWPPWPRCSSPYRRPKHRVVTFSLHLLCKKIIFPASLGCQTFIGRYHQ